MIKLMAILLAVLATVPLNSNADECLLGGVLIPGNERVIEGTSGADMIDCRESSAGHDIYGLGGADIIYGSEHDDFISGGSSGDTIYGLGGKDNIDGGGNDDYIDGGDGDDFIFGGVGSSSASGVGCDPLAFIAAGSSYLTKGGSGDDEIHGGGGDDCIDAGSGEDRVYGGEGNDTIEGGNHNDMLDGGPGNDYIDGGWHTDTCIGGGGSDTIFNCESEPPYCGDGICEPGEDSCTCAVDCGPPAVNEIELFCADELDNDCDENVDCDDSECKEYNACQNDCEPLGNSCVFNSDCCSDKCKGKSGSKTCK